MPPGQARVALRFPWWTLAHGFRQCAELAQLPADASAVQAALDESSSVNKAGLPPGMAASRTPTQVGWACRVPCIGAHAEVVMQRRACIHWLLA